MSKGEIIGHIADGKYRVRQKLAVEKIKEELIELNARIAELAVELPTAKLELLQANDAVKDKVREIDLAIPDLQAGVDGARTRITGLQRELVQLRTTARLAELRVSELITENLAALKRRNQLESVPEGRELELWCADYTLDLDGEVGLVDVNDEGGQGIIIQPGHNDGAAYSATRDGSLFPGIAQSGPQIYFNAAILPGVQKWLPRYRVGEITKLQADICTVILDPAVSSAQGLSINQTDTLTDIPIVYMDCDGSAFQKGDRVLVRFTENGPLVVGFEKKPVPCTLFGFVFEPAHISGRAGVNLVAIKETYGEPFEANGSQINPPLGTSGGANNAWTAIPNASNLVIERGKARNYGNKNWFNSDKLVLSWSGPPGRAHRMEQFDYGLSGFQADWKTEPYVFHDLDIILDLSAEAVAGDFDNVFGASVWEDGQQQRWLVVIASDKEYIPPDTRDTVPGQTFKSFRVPIDSAFQATGPLEFLHQYTLPVEMNYQSHFYFSDSGDKAVCTLVGDVLDADNLQIDLLRYDLASGFSVQQIWTRNQAIGTLTVNESYAVQSDTPEPGQVTTTGSLYRSYQTSSYLIPIYCDFIGDREVIAYERHAAIDSIRQAQFNELSTATIAYTASGSLEENHSGNFEVVTSDGNILFRMPHKPDKSELITYDSLQDGSGGHFRVNNSEDSRVGGIDWEENILAVDLRFDFCAVAYGGYQYTLNESVNTTYNDPDFGAGAVPASGTISGNEIIEIVEFWLGGAMVKQEEAFRISGPIEINSYAPDPKPNIGITGSNSSSQTDIKPFAPLKVSSKYLLTAGAYRTGVHSIGAVSMNYKTGSSSRKSVLLNHVSGFADPVVDILERTEADDYLLCSIGLI